MATPIQRQHLKGLMELTIQHEPQIHYAEIRPMRSIHYSEQQITNLLAHGGQFTMDCSEGITCLCKWAGLQDPNGLHFNGEGYTGTLLAHLHHYTDAKKANIGAIVIFGPGTGEHAAMVMTPDHKHGNPILWSHGQERGPLSISLQEEASYHSSPVTFLSIAHL